MTYKIYEEMKNLQVEFQNVRIFHCLRDNSNFICLTLCFVSHNYVDSGQRHSLTPLYALLTSWQSYQLWDYKRVTGWETSTGGERASAHAPTDVGEGAEVRGESAQWVGQEQRHQEAGAVGRCGAQSADTTDSAAQPVVTLWTRG